MTELIQKNKHYLVKSPYGTYTFNNRKTAQQLHTTLTQYEKIQKQYKETEKKLDKITRTLIQLQITHRIAEAELDNLKEALQ